MLPVLANIFMSQNKSARRNKMPRNCNNYSVRGRESIRGYYGVRVVEVTKNIFNGRGRLQPRVERSPLVNLLVEGSTEKNSGLTNNTHT